MIPPRRGRTVGLEVLPIVDRPHQRERYPCDPRRVDGEVRRLLRHQPSPPRCRGTARPGYPPVEIDAVVDHPVGPDRSPRGGVGMGHRRQRRRQTSSGGERQRRLQPGSRRRVQGCRHDGRRQQAGARERQVVDRVDVHDVMTTVLELEDGLQIAVMLGQGIARSGGHVATRSRRGLEADGVHPTDGVRTVAAGRVDGDAMAATMQLRAEQVGVDFEAPREGLSDVEPRVATMATSSTDGRPSILRSPPIERRSGRLRISRPTPSARLDPTAGLR